MAKPESLLYVGWIGHILQNRGVLSNKGHYSWLYERLTINDSLLMEITSLGGGHCKGG